MKLSWDLGLWRVLDAARTEGPLGYRFPFFSRASGQWGGQRRFFRGAPLSAALLLSTLCSLSTSKQAQAENTATAEAAKKGAAPSAESPASSRKTAAASQQSPAPPSRADTQSILTYPKGQGQRTAVEVSLIQEALDHYGLTVEPHPEGKRITEIVVYVARVFDDRDPIPNVFNIFHVKTRDFMVRQEVLQNVGDTWEIGRILETERNLRGLRQLSVANVVAVRGDDDGTIKLLVVAKDVWSLRLNSDIEFSNTGLTTLLLNPTEENFAGLRATLGGIFLLQRDRYLVGANLGYPRLPGTRLGLSMVAGGYRNRWTGEAEGSYGSFSFSLPLFSRHSKWAYGADASFRLDVARFYNQGAIRKVDVETADGAEASVPYVFHSELMSASYWGIRSFGVDHKTDMEWGLSLDHRRYRPYQAENYAPAVVDAFSEQWLPVSDTRISPYVELSVYETRFLRESNIETLGLQEDIRLGYGVSTSVFVAGKSFGSSRDLIGTRATASYTQRLGDGLVRAGASSRIVVADRGKNEGFASASARFASPHLLFLRFHLDSYLGVRFADYLNVSGFSLGVNNRLRGYAVDAFLGKNIWVNNAELRTDGIDILSAQVGLAAFYDLGGVSNDWQELMLRQTAGMGLRVVFPQADRTVFRFDWGFPLSGDVAALPGAFFFTFGQAFPLPDPQGKSSPFIE